jgi:uncharacterized protein YndB with AHSA1/START domain
MTKKNTPAVECQMLIRRPASQVFQAFLDPNITTNFWFTKSSGFLETGKTVIWEWEMYGVSVPVFTKEIINDRKISIEWGDPSTNVDFEFETFSEDTTYVVIKHYGFDLSGDELINAIKDSTGGFTTVLDGLKAFMEHDLKLNLIADKFPQKVKL